MADTRATAGRPQMVDYWCNLFTPDGLRSLYVEPPEFSWVRTAWAVGSRLDGHSVPEFLEVMDSADVERVGIPSTKLYNYVERHLIWDVDVREVSDIVDDHPDRFFGVFGVNPLDRMRGVHDLRSALRDHNFRAALLHPHGFGMEPNAREWYPFFAACADLGAPVFSLVGHAAEEMPSRPGRPLFLEDVALYFPELTIVGCSGWPWVEEMISMAWKFPNVYYGTSQYAPANWPEELVSFAGGRGAGKVLFGSGYPVLEHERARRQIEAFELSSEAEEQLLRGTALRVLGFGEDGG